jgi:hypothetical protein
MSLPDLAAALTKLIGSNGALLLDPAAFSAPELASLRGPLGSALVAAGISQLQVSGARVGSATAVTVDGGATMFGAKPGTVHLEVTAELTVTLAFTVPAGWGFADGFPGLPSSYQHLSANPGLVGLGPSALYGLALASATLTATSGSPDLAFTGLLANSTQFTFLATALSLPTQPPLTGTIRLNGAAPATPDLTVGGGLSTLHIGDLLELTDIGLHAHTVPQDPSTGDALTRLDLDATIEAGSQDPVPIKLSAPFYDLAGVLELTADFGAAGLSIGRGAHAFAELLGLDVGSFSLPSPLDVLEKLALLSMTCIVTIDPPGVQRVVFTVGPGQAWTIASGAEVDNLTLGWAIAFPFDSAARSMSASIAGTLVLGTVEPKLEFDVIAFSQGGFTAMGDLAQPMTLTQIATTINGGPVGGLPDLTVINAAISASTSGDFGVLVDLGNWPVGSVGDTPIVLYEVLASLERTGGAIAAQFLTVLGVGTARLFLSAQLHMSPQAPAGWVFDGGTQPGTALAIGDLLTELAGTFGITQVPEPISSLTLTALNLHYDTAASHFSFSCEADFTVQTTATEKTDIAVIVSIDVAPTAKTPAASAAPADPASPPAVTVAGTKGYSATFKGTVTFGAHQFDIAFSASPDTDVLVADYHHQTGDTPVSLHDLVAQVSPSLAADIPDGIVVDLEEVKFVFLKQAATQWAFGLRLGVSINLNELPVVGSHLPPEETLALENLQLLYSSADLTPTQTAIINPLLAAGVAPLPATVPHGIAFDTDVRLGTVVKHLHAGVTPPAPAGPAALPAPSAGTSAGVPAPASPAQAVQAGASSTDPITWFDVNRQFGVFSFDRVGAGYRDNVLLFALDASVAVGPLAFSLQALTVGSKLTAFDPVFSLDGLALEFDRPPITISGAFLRSIDSDGATSYYGELMVGVASFALKAIGGWTPEKNSFFIYVSIDVPLGGPPFLFVTGLAGGFGINRRLILPSIETAGVYPLLPGQAPAEQASPAATISALINTLKDLIPAAVGEYWVAAGIRFTSFEMIESLVVVSVEFGVDVQVGVVGVVTMTFPTGAGDEAIAHVEIDLVASFTPSTGLLAVDGRLSPQSFLLGGFVKLTGGFAFRAWFSGPYHGDFLVSLGGYHPSFVKPDNYPAVPRLGLAFVLGPLKVTGESYFALTPHAFMAGLRLAATFEAGPIKVWFDAGVDILFQWAPFHYEADAYVDIGCSVDLGLFTLTVHIGADLQIWGPAFGGTALIDLTIISFTIPFGAPKAPPPPVGWDTLATKFLPADTPAATPAVIVAPPVQASRMAPMAAMARVSGSAAAPTPTAATKAAPAAESDPGAAATNVVKADVATGKLKTDATDAAGHPLDWIVDPDHFRIVTTSVIPANRVEWTTALDKNQAPVVASLPNDLTLYHRGLPASDGSDGSGGAVDDGTAPDPSGDPSANPDPPGTPPDQTWPPAGGPAALADLYLWVETTRPATGPVWYPTLHVTPMDQTDVISHHTIGISKIENGIAAYLPPPGLAVRPVCTASNTALWGEKQAGSDAPASQTANAARLIMGTLTGLEISPVPQHPDQVSDIPLLQLSYQQDLSTRFGYSSLAADTSYTVTSQPGTSTDPSGQKHSTLTIDVTGAAQEQLPNQDYQLSCLTNTWVTGQRASVLGQLRTLGFGTLTPGEVDLSTAARIPLPDWPVITRIGASA